MRCFQPDPPSLDGSRQFWNAALNKCARPHDPAQADPHFGGGIGNSDQARRHGRNPGQASADGYAADVRCAKVDFTEGAHELDYNLPTLACYPQDLDWKSLDPNLAGQILSFPNEITSARMLRQF